MSDFKKQYDKELKYQEEKSNKYTLNGVVMLIAVELIVWAQKDDNCCSYYFYNIIDSDCVHDYERRCIKRML